MNDALRDLVIAMKDPLANAQAATAAAPNGPQKHAALLALGSIQIARLALLGVLDGLGSVGMTSTPTARA